MTLLYSYESEMDTPLSVNRIYKTMDNWVLIALPMFILMGLMLDRSGIAENMMYAIQRLFGRVRGGLAVTVTCIGVILAASTGIVGASVVLLGLLSVPAMLSQGYSKTLALGTVASSGTLGILIPPSIMLVIRFCRKVFKKFKYSRSPVQLCCQRVEGFSLTL
jgi:TRAP-type mannitol/chloroaromatic compound transport system permease large subunit